MFGACDRERAAQDLSRRRLASQSERLPRARVSVRFVFGGDDKQITTMRHRSPSLGIVNHATASPMAIG